MKRKIVLFFIPLIVILLVSIFGKRENEDEINLNMYSDGTGMNAVSYLKSKANGEGVTDYTQGNVHEMYTFNQPSTYHVPETKDYRYIGYDTHNYIYFNCQNVNDSSTCELWRIIGVFDDKIKIMKNDSIGRYAYDENGSTDWATSTLNEYLNGDYYNSLSVSSKNMIADNIYFLNRLSYSELVDYNNLYTLERKYGNNGDFNNQYSSYARDWTGKFALMYPSDYLFANGLGMENFIADCWMNPTSGIVTFLNRENVMTSNDEIYAFNNGLTSISSTEENDIKPVTYLKNDLLIARGNGSIDDPYIFLTRDDYSNYKFQYNFGDKIYYNNELYYVIAPSTSDSDYVTVIKDVPLVEKYTNHFSTGSVSYYTSDKCYFESEFINNISECKNDYSSSNVKKIVEGWANHELDANDLVLVDGYKARLITFDEIIDNFKFEAFSSTGGGVSYKTTSETPSFIKSRTPFTTTWTMSSVDDSNKVYMFSYNISDVNPYIKSDIQPVLNIKKTSVGNKDVYQVGDEITYKDSLYYVIADSSSSSNYITVMKANPLTYDEIYNYLDSKDDVVKTSYKACNGYNCTGNDFRNSDAKKIIDYWLDVNFDSDDLETVDGYRGRLITVDDAISYLYYDYQHYNIAGTNWGLGLKFTDKTPLWAYSYDYWTMTQVDDSDDEVYVLNVYGDVMDRTINDNFYIRPIIYLKKSAINKVRNIEPDVNDSDSPKCTLKYRKEKITKYSKYSIGEEVNYKGEKYYVINESNSGVNYVTLLKADVLKENDVSINTDFYSNDTCYNDENLNNCKNTYIDSNIKKLVDKWVSDNNMENDLVEVNGYKTRLLNAIDLFKNFNLKFLRYLGEYGLPKNIYYSYDMPSFLYENVPSYWTMITSIYSDGRFGYIINDNGDLSGYDLETNRSVYVFDSYAIRPVINLNKCALDGGCTIEEIDIPEGCIEDDNNKNSIVEVASTLSLISKFLLIISTLLIILGVSIIGYNYIKSRKSKSKMQ